MNMVAIDPFLSLITLLILLLLLLLLLLPLLLLLLLLLYHRFQLCRNEKLTDDDTTPIDPDELIRKAWETPLEPSSDLLMPLLQYQKEGIFV